MVSTKNIKRTLIIVFCSIFIGIQVYSQQLSFSSQYYTNPFVTNPAFTGNTSTINSFITHRSQWISIPGSPQTSCLTVDGPLDIKNIGLGLKLYSYAAELLTTSGAFATYSYKLKLNEVSNLNLGLSMGLLHNKINYEKAKVYDANDPFVLQQQQSKATFSTDFGLLYTNKQIEAGFAIPQILANKIKYGSIDGTDSYYRVTRHYQGSFKYVMDISKKKGITAYPLVMFRSAKGAPFQYDINAVVDWKKNGWLGVTYHSNYAIALSAGLRYKSLCIGYAYDLGITKTRTSAGRSMEFLLGYNYTIPKKENIIIDTTSGEIWAEEIQASSMLIKPEDYEESYWNSLNKNIDQSTIFNTITQAVLNGELQAYDLVTDSPLSISQARTFLNKANGGQLKDKKVTEYDLSKIRTVEKWVYNPKRFTLTKRVTRIDLLIKRIDEQGNYTGTDRALFYVKLKK